MKKNNKSDAATLRQKAEELLKEKQLKAGLQFYETETQKLIHELGVHQIELELQNEELLLAYERSEVASEKYTELYDFAPSGYFTLSKEGEIIELNHSGANMIGKERSRLENSLFVFFVSDATKPIFNHFLEKVFTSQAKESCEVALLTKDNSPMYVHLTGMVTENGEQCLISTIDITEHKRVEEERLESSEERYRLLYENAKIGLYRTAPDGTIILANKALVAMLGYQSFDELAKRNLEQDGFEPPYQRKVFIEKIEQNGEVVNFESTWIRQDRTTVFVQESAQAIRDSVGNTMYYDGTAEDITERKKIENALKESEKKLKTIFEIMPVGITVLDGDRKIVEANHAIEKILDISIDDLLKGSYKSRSYLKADQTPMNFEEYASVRALKEQKPVDNVVTGVVKEDGNVIWTDVSAVPVTFLNWKVVLVTSDITERKQAEQALRDSEARYHLLFEGSADGIIIVDIETKTFKYANPALCRMLGYTEEELITLGIADIHPEQDLQWIIAVFESQARGEKTLAPDIPCLRKDGSIVYADINTNTINIDGRLCAMGHFRDITERKQAEEALRYERTLLRLLIDNIPDLIYTKDTACRKTLANLADVQHTGAKSEAEVLGKDDFAFHPKERAEKFFADDQSVIQTGQPLFNKEEYTIDNEGQTKWLLTSKFPLKDERGQMIGLVGITRDITERKQAEEALKSALEHSHQQQAVVTIIAISPQLAAGDVQGLAHQVNELAAKAINVERVSMWLFNDEENELRCVDLYEQSPDCHSAGAVLLKKEYKNEFEALQTAKYIDANDPLTDPRTAGYVEGYLKPLKITSMLDAVIRDGNRNIGVLCFEHVEKKHNWEPDEIAFASQLADQIALTVLNHERILAEESLKSSEEQYRTLFENVPVGIGVSDLTGNLIAFNDAMLKPGGYSHEDIIGIGNVENLYYNLSDREEVISLMKEKGFVNQHPIKFKRKDGSSYDTLLSLSIIHFKDQRRIQALVEDITERKHAEEAIRNERTLLRTIIDLIPDAIYAKDIEGRKTLSNLKEVQLTGKISEAELIGKTDFELYPEIVAKRSLDEDKLIIQSGEPILDIESSLIDKDGQVHWQLGSKVPLLDMHGHITGIVGFSHDTTKSKQAEIILRDSEKKYRLLIETVNEGILVSQNGFLKFANPMMQLITGFTQEELLTLPFINYVYHEDRELVINNHLKRLKEEQFLPRYQFRIVKKDGSTRRIEMNEVIIEWEGQPATLNMLTDITERKQTEENLLESEERYRLIAENTADTIVVLDLNLHFTYISPSILKLRGFSVEEAMTQSLDQAFTPDSLQKIIAAFSYQMALEADVNADPYRTETLELEEFCKDGSIIFIETAMSFIRDSNFNPTGILTVTRDITERKLAEEEVLHKNEQLLKLNAEKDKFFSIIAHDLKSPFNSFLGLTQIMAEELPNLTMSQVQEIAVSMSKSATNLYRLLENLLQWSQIQKGAIPFNRETVKLYPIVNDCIALMSETAKIKEIGVTHDLPDNFEVYADNNMLQTVIRNLVSNAVKFTPKGGKISVSAKVLNDNSVEISVKDTGIGMSQAMVGNLFRLDIQTNRKGTEGEPSTGLGLLLCKEFVEKLGGKIWVESEEGKGSEFRFTLPVGN